MHLNPLESALNIQEDETLAKALENETSLATVRSDYGEDGGSRLRVLVMVLSGLGDKYKERRRCFRNVMRGFQYSSYFFLVGHSEDSTVARWVLK